jgi:sporulation protein YlmC with PRC-barrel domain
MTDRPSTLRHSELLNRLVLNRDTLEELGRIEVLWMYPPMHRVLGFVCKAGFLGKRKLAFKLSQVEAIGENGILTHSPPDETDRDRVRQLESLIECEVWSQAGDKIGKIIDCEFDLRTGQITAYLMLGDAARMGFATRLSMLASTIYRLPPAQIVSFGHTGVLVEETSIQAFTPYREGISQTFSKVSNTLKDESAQVAEELRSLGKRAQKTTQQTTGQLKSLAEQARERAIMFAEQAKETAQTLAEQVQETSETFIEQLQDDNLETEQKPNPDVVIGSDDDFDFDFDFEELDIEKPVNPSQPDRPPIAPTEPPQKRPSEPPIHANNWQVDNWQIDEEPWLQGDEYLASDPSLIETSWDIDDDPWNITELPEPTEPILTPLLIPDASDAIAPPSADASEPTPTPTEAEAVVQHLLDEINLQTSDSVEINPKTSDPSDDEPWI